MAGEFRRTHRSRASVELRGGEIRLLLRALTFYSATMGAVTLDGILEDENEKAIRAALESDVRNTLDLFVRLRLAVEDLEPSDGDSSSDR